ncbi:MULTISPECIES: DUF4186 domain-containing protein [Tatumella]|mgnify:CR=1 FL=1|uniref:DUF4186 domain-containing protein n=1 Tax=Tatumella punctata TaxID=399969 RepID=A0ABW1VRK6_9GAMM|nr:MULTISPECIES: DUF4186 domain-containing protein [unclassified Tatumella]MBS0856007.1 DUF4186 domain-containing protein [Tatumella sp. JGM16]MBS0878066.1 DUF4186 domain-containing protein [Tatumella sp. JGM82]MBS0890425.1 DUF4186 domain-containing protein [Tatumella sp. JGM94]MBS0894686.1 DUF4186 domain-containing protein [Tatumella sp. JGM130]MBS0900881.1 DUF4186 domain-containing protein [Tatumella sp. JGM100]
MISYQQLSRRLAGSPFRSRFHLGVKERQYCLEKGAEVVMQHAADFVRQRLSAAEPVNDGKQTPMRGHPVFIAQHATATCCRGCLEKWHRIPARQPLDDACQRYICDVLFRWLQGEITAPAPSVISGK